VGSPKDQVFIDLLDEHEDVGRFIVWGGFTGTIDRLTEMAHQYGWATLRVDGRGFIAMSATNDPQSPGDFLDAMDLSNPRYKELLERYPKVCFVGHPQAGGMALTLTASPTEFFYSNSFNGEARMQSEDRFHRAGMDENRGATIIDCICLPTDQMVLTNLKQKKKLQNMSMGEMEEALKDIEERAKDRELI
jgi:SNF2 family DNA or RNA helicase